MYQGEKYQVFEIFDFLAGWNLKFSAFGNAVKKIQFFYDRVRFASPYIQLHTWICMYTTLFMYNVLCTRFWIVPGFLLPGFLSFLKSTRFHSTRFFVFFEKYQVSKYQVFQKSTSFRYQVGEKYQVKSTRPGTFLSNLVKKKPMTFNAVRSVEWVFCNFNSEILML